MTTQGEEIYNNSQICWICREDLNTDKVRDHCHVRGKFRRAAHNECNLKLKIPKKLPIIFHNLKEYDGHIVFKKLNNFDVTLYVISKTIEKYITRVLLLIEILLFLTQMNFIKLHWKFQHQIQKIMILNI